MNEIHLNTLIQIGDKDQGYVGSNSLNWATYVLPNNSVIDKYLDRQFTRYELFDYCQNPNNDNLNVLLAILSWGGMNRRHGTKLFLNSEPVLNLVNDLRKGVYKNRQSAFNAFQANRLNGLLPGLGIGYFTKLICFLSPNLNAYIMDQWVSKSINLLTNENTINITNYRGSGWVNDKNNSETYELFCTKIDELANILGCDGFEAEKRLFSVGRGQGIWRNYLIENYNK
jgi:hypothetical protein